MLTRSLKVDDDEEENVECTEKMRKGMVNQQREATYVSYEAKASSSSAP